MEQLAQTIAAPVTNPGIMKFDNCLRDEDREKIYEFLRQPSWGFGWKAEPMTDRFSFWHRHFAGPITPDHYEALDHLTPVDCAAELQKEAPLLYGLWAALSASVLRGHRLVRCYANGQTYGSDGSLHTDSMAPNSYTVIYYPHDRWSPNWAGETVFFSPDKTDIIASIYPRPNRMVCFPGTVPHLARGVSRTCPVMRITLMFKTELSHA
ncbi:2OG-Fe(II) oxygenase [Ferrovibrio sp.]|uniref:2OG-Fe(II) oxygenase n=1 Tax=Ferrovibrio sp. TaxID=1917215 RepID=UPI003513E656